MGNFINELKNYQPIPRNLIFDNTMSDRARFLFCYMASKPEDWNFYLSAMSKELGYSVETVRKYITELIEKGWLVKGQQKNDGRFGAVSYTLKAHPCLEKQSTKNTDTEKVRHGKSPAHTENIYNKQKRDLENKNSLSLLEKEKTATGSSSSSASIVAEPYLADAWSKWVEYSTQSFQAPPSSLMLQYEKLKEYSHGSADLANCIIERAILGMYRMFTPPQDAGQQYYNTIQRPTIARDSGGWE